MTVECVKICQANAYIKSGNTTYRTYKWFGMFIQFYSTLYCQPLTIIAKDNRICVYLDEHTLLCQLTLPDLDGALVVTRRRVFREKN